MADNSINQDDIDSLLAELQGTGESGSAIDQTKLGEHSIAHDDIEGLLGMSEQSDPPDPVPPAGPAPTESEALEQERNLLEDAVAETPPEEEEASPTASGETVENEFAGYDFSNISIDTPDQEQPAIAPTPLSAASSTDLGAVIIELRQLRAELKQLSRSAPGGGRLSSVISIMVLPLILGLLGYLVFLEHQRSPRGAAPVEVSEPAPAIEPDIPTVEKEPTTGEPLGGEALDRELEPEETELGAPSEDRTPPPPRDIPPGEDSELELAKNFVYKGFKLTRKGRRSELLFRLDETISEEYVKRLEVPRRLVLDLRQTKPLDSKWSMSVKNPVIRQVRMGIQPGNTLRLVIEFKNNELPRYAVELTPEGVKVVVHH